jgi:hypothetical protein
MKILCEMRGKIATHEIKIQSTEEVTSQIDPTTTATPKDTSGDSESVKSNMSIESISND